MTMPVRPFFPMMMPPPPAPWRAAVDPTSRLPYYYNEKTGATQWDFPRQEQPPPPPPPPSKKAIPMPDPEAEPEAYEAWKSVMQHVQGGMAAKMTGRDMDGVPRPTEKQCNDFAQGKCNRGAGCKFLHGDVRPSDDRRRKRDYDDDRGRRRRRIDPKP